MRARACSYTVDMCAHVCVCVCVCVRARACMCASIRGVGTDRFGPARANFFFGTTLDLVSGWMLGREVRGHRTLEVC